MEEALQLLAQCIARVLDLVTILLLALGSIFGIWNLITGALERKAHSLVALTVWQGLSRWILVALQFMLASDLVETLVAPSWDAIGKLGAIVLIRTVLGYFLGRDAESARRIVQEEKDLASQPKRG